MAYLTIEELKQKSVIDSIKNASAEDDSRLQLLLDYCSALIDSCVGFKFIPENDLTVYVDGDGNKKIALYKRIFNIIEVSEGTSGYKYNVANIRIVGDKKNKLMSLTEDFREGYDNILVRGDFGWESAPEDVINCLVILCNANYSFLADEDRLQFAMGPFKSEKIANYSYEVKDNSKLDSSTKSTGNSQVDLILEQYSSNDFSIGVV